MEISRPSLLKNYNIPICDNATNRVLQAVECRGNIFEELGTSMHGIDGFQWVPWTPNKLSTAATMA